MRALLYINLYSGLLYCSFTENTIKEERSNLILKTTKNNKNKLERLLLKNWYEFYTSKVSVALRSSKAFIAIRTFEYS